MLVSVTGSNVVGVIFTPGYTVAFEIFFVAAAGFLNMIGGTFSRAVVAKAFFLAPFCIAVGVHVNLTRITFVKPVGQESNSRNPNTSRTSPLSGRATTPSG